LGQLYLCARPLALDQPDVGALARRRQFARDRAPVDQHLVTNVGALEQAPGPTRLLIENTDARSRDYEKIKDRFRPGHADYTYQQKYGFRDYRGGGRSSARETVMRVAAGAIAEARAPAQKKKATPAQKAKAEKTARAVQKLPPEKIVAAAKAHPNAKRLGIENVTPAVECGRFPAKAVVAPPQTFDAVRDGLADLSFGVHGYTPGRFALTDVVEFPFMGDTAEVTAVAYHRIWEKMLKQADEHKGVVPLAVFFASYLADKRQLLSVATNRLGPFMVPPARAFACRPMLMMISSISPREFMSAPTPRAVWLS
jgi:hypothetical protein